MRIKELNVTSSTALGALGEALVLPVMQLLSVPRALVFLPVLAALFANTAGAGSPVAGPMCGGFDALALVVGQVCDSLGEGQQHPALDDPVLGPGAAGPAAGLPATGDEATETQDDPMVGRTLTYL